MLFYLIIFSNWSLSTTLACFLQKDIENDMLQCDFIKKILNAINLLL